MTIYYRSTAIGDPYGLGSNKLGAAQRAEFGGAGVVYTLGAVSGKGFAYTTDPKEELAPVMLDTLPAMADRIDYLVQTPAIYNRNAKLADVSKALRVFVPPAMQFGAPPLPQTPLPAKTGSLSAVPGFLTPRSGISYSGGEGASAAYVGNTANWDPYIAAGAKIMRIPMRYGQFAPGGDKDTFAADGSVLSGPIVDQWHAGQTVIWLNYLPKRGVAVMIDDHSYRDMANNDIAQYWVKHDKAIKAECARQKLPDLTNTDLLIYELQNEPKCDPKTYGAAMFRTIHGLRAAGVTATLGIGWGFYNKYSSFTQYMDAIEAAGGMANLDPLNRLVFLPHDYWEPSGNDMSGKVAGSIVIADRYADMLKTARKYGLTLLFGEIGLGGGSPRWLPSDGSGTKKDGAALFVEYQAWALANTDVVKGTIAWGGGRMSPTYSYHIDLSSDQGKALAAFWKTNV